MFIELSVIWEFIQWQIAEYLRKSIIYFVSYLINPRSNSWVIQPLIEVQSNWFICRNSQASTSHDLSQTVTAYRRRLSA
jgi:hypothetical protein